MAAENMRKVETMRRKTLEKLRKRWYLVARRVIIDSVDLADPDRRSTIVRPVEDASLLRRYREFHTCHTQICPARE